MKIATRPCPACQRPQGSSAECLSCRDAAARELAREAADITDWSGGVPARWVDHPPWYARRGAGKILTKLRLLAMILNDYATGQYRKIPWQAIAVCAAASAYVVLPFDLIPDWLVPVGWTDDLFVLAIAWNLVKKELREYCAWKGVSPAHFGL
ncbi:MAG TPA: YkvA family protein [Anaeromyxobacteraceae bacterium]|nr:YkvA family protein [Anaeromyxobacteraceae bacterium]